MKKLIKFITLIGLAGAAIAGFWYFLDSRNNNISEDSKEDEAEEKDDAGERSYVSIKTEEECKKEALTKAVTDAVKDTIAKADEEAEGLGVVKEDMLDKANDFEFKSFDEKTEE